MVTLVKIGSERSVFSNYMEFLIDSEEDLTTLPTAKNKKNLHECPAVSSVAYSADLSVIAMLGNDDEWHRIG